MWVVRELETVPEEDVRGTMDDKDPFAVELSSKDPRPKDPSI
jgi:hypothetical protein